MSPCSTTPATEPLTLESFRPFTLADRPVIERAIPPELAEFCDFNFNNLVVWGRVLQELWRPYKRWLLLFNAETGNLAMPLGPWPSEAELTGLADEMKRAGGSGRVALVPEWYVAQHPGLADHFRIEDDPDNADYVYSSDRLAELRGNLLAKKRNLVSQFLRNYPDFQCRPFPVGPSRHCLELIDRWEEEKGGRNPELDIERRALTLALENYVELGYEGLCLHVGDTPVALAIFSPQTADMVTVHFEKFDRRFKGASQMINRETARLVRPRFAWINREQDMGDEGLRQAKRSYGPDRMLLPKLLTPR